MASTTIDFEAWLSDNEPEGHEEIFGLYSAAHGEDGGVYSVTEAANGVRIITGPNAPALALVSANAISAFQKHIERYKDDPEMDWDSWYGYKIYLTA